MGNANKELEDAMDKSSLSHHRFLKTSALAGVGASMFNRANRLLIKANTLFLISHNQMLAGFAWFNGSNDTIQVSRQTISTGTSTY